MGFLFEILHSLDSRVGKFSTEKMEFATELIAGLFIGCRLRHRSGGTYDGLIYLIGGSRQGDMGRHHRLSLGRKRRATRTAAEEIPLRVSDIKEKSSTHSRSNFTRHVRLLRIKTSPDRGPPFPHLALRVAFSTSALLIRVPPPGPARYA